MRKCNVCDTEFEPRTHNQIYCSRRCRDINRSTIIKYRYTEGGIAAAAARWAKKGTKELEEIITVFKEEQR